MYVRATRILRLAATLTVLLITADCSTPSVKKKVLLIGLDGVRVDILERAYTPNIDALVAKGTFSNDAQTRPPTVSGPGWSSMLTGVWADKHLVRGNDFTGHDYATYPDFLTRLEQLDPELNTFAVVDWPPLGATVSGGPMISDLIDVKLLVDGDELGYAHADSQSVAMARAHLIDKDPDVAFVYLGNVDVVGHDTHSLSPDYEAAIETADTHVGLLVEALKLRPTYAEEDWLILMSTDHGRRDDGSHGQPSLQERTIFYLVSGPSARKGVPQRTPEIVDVAVTALTHLGVDIVAAWNLDGQVVGLESRE